LEVGRRTGDERLTGCALLQMTVGQNRGPSRCPQRNPLGKSGRIPLAMIALSLAERRRDIPLSRWPAAVSRGVLLLCSAAEFKRVMLIPSTESNRKAKGCDQRLRAIEAPINDG
jgi:hypothetical protein